MSYEEIDVEIIKVTPDAILVDAGNPEKHWIPISLISEDSYPDIAEESYTTIEVKRWFLEKESIV